MSGQKFKDLFRGKEDIFQEKINADGELLSKLEACGIITNDQRTVIEVTFYCIQVLLKLILHNLNVQLRQTKQKIF